MHVPRIDDAIHDRLLILQEHVVQVNVVLDLIEPQLEILELLLELLTLKARQSAVALAEIPQEVLGDVHVGDHDHQRDDDR